MRLCDVCDFQGGSQPPKNEWSFEQKDGYIRMLQIRDFTQTRNVEKEYIKLTSSTKTCVTEDILIARYGASIGKILTGLSGAYNVAIMKTIPNEGILNKSYLKYYLHSNYFQNGINSVGARAAQAGFNKEDLSKLYIPVVSLVQQKLIVDKLNKLTTFIGKRKTQLEKLDELVKSRFVELFGDPYINDKNWTMKTFGDICTVRQGLQIPISKRLTQYEEDCYEYITVAYLHGSKDREYIKSPKSTVICTKDDILMTRTGNTGMVVTDVEGVFHNNFFLIDFDRTKYSKRFLVEYLNLDLIQTEIIKRAGTSTIPDLNHGQFYAISIYEPPIELQNKFATFVEQTDKSKLEVQKSLEKLELLKKALMQKYFG